MGFVLDASIALSWCFEDEATAETTALLELLETELVYVPQLWSLELGNILLAAERRHRISRAEITEFLTLLETLPIQIDHEPSMRAFREILSLAHSTQLTTYDATYLELAMRLGVSLATKDKQLRAIAKSLGVMLLPLP